MWFADHTSVDPKDNNRVAIKTPLLHTEMFDYSITAKSHKSKELIWILAAIGLCSLILSEKQTPTDWVLSLSALNSGRTTAATQLKIQICHGQDGLTDGCHSKSCWEEQHFFFSGSSVTVICSVRPAWWPNVSTSYAAIVIQTVMTVNRNSTERDSLSIISMSQPAHRQSWQLPLLFRRNKGVGYT